MQPNNYKYPVITPKAVVGTSSKTYPALDWVADKNKTEDELYERAFNFCTEYLQFSNNMFTG